MIATYCQMLQCGQWGLKNCNLYHLVKSYKTLKLKILRIKLVEKKEKQYRHIVSLNFRHFESKF